jgi:predicted phosphodiesterase
MNIRFMSDLHIEFLDFQPTEVPSDVIVLAGDILTEHYGITWARKTFPKKPIVYVMGNHEFYDAHYERVLERARKEASDLDIHLLERD